MNTSISRVALFVLLILVCNLPATARAAALPDPGEDLIEEMAIGFRYTWGGEFQTLDLLELTGIGCYPCGNSEHAAAVFAFSLVGRDIIEKKGEDPKEIWHYSFTGPVNLAMMGLTELATLALESRDAKLTRSPFGYVFFAPNSNVNVRFHKDFKFTVATHTEYVFARTHVGERGILFTPQAGVTLSGGSHTYWNGIPLTAGYRNWWSFDRDSRSEGWSVGVLVFVSDLPHY